jgi:hypothetical protein
MDSREKIEASLDTAILDTLEKLRSLPVGSQEYLKATVSVSQLYKSRDQQYKAESDYNGLIDAKELELKAKREELEVMKSENRKNRTIQVATTIGTLGFWGYQFGKTLKFEETGTATSSVFKTLFKVFRIN